ncbi:hypothetical protein EI94DRAFT_786767 [Lactarius quietus]|nr:hypothetical protein EI94DRAFT_786767 [Lactarius quietus]
MTKRGTWRLLCCNQLSLLSPHLENHPSSLVPIQAYVSGVPNLSSRYHGRVDRSVAVLVLLGRRVTRTDMAKKHVLCAAVIVRPPRRCDLCDAARTNATHTQHSCFSRSMLVAMFTLMAWCLILDRLGLLSTRGRSCFLRRYTGMPERLARGPVELFQCGAPL